LPGISPGGKEAPTGLLQPTKQHTSPALPCSLTVTGSGKCWHLSAPQQNIVLGHSPAANRVIVFDGKQEGTHGTRTKSGPAGEDSAEYRETMLTPSSLLYFQESSATVQLNGPLTGSLKGIRKQHLATTTLPLATIQVAAIFWNHFEPSPLACFFVSKIVPVSSIYLSVVYLT
jgi:hypothetical protein